MHKASADSRGPFVATSKSNCSGPATSMSWFISVGLLGAGAAITRANCCFGADGMPAAPPVPAWSMATTEPAMTRSNSLTNMQISGSFFQ
jgi:hypothetical protein